MNFIFDIGNVLINFKPLEYLQDLFGDDENLIYKMGTTVFLSPEWNMLDQGLLTGKEAIDIFCNREQNYKTAIVKTMTNLTKMLTPIPESLELLPQIKEAGHKLYFLSNMLFDHRDYLLSNFSFWEMFDGGVFSCDILEIKPAPAIYHHLLDKYQLNAKDCIFFDDREENVVAADELGVKGVLFTDAGCVLPLLE